MRIQKQILYAIDAVGMIAESQQKDFSITMQTSEVAEALGISKEFTRNLMGNLVKHGVLVSAKGPIGGYRLSGPPETITVSAIVDAMAPKELQGFSDNLLNTQTLLAQEICEGLQHETRMLFDKPITHFVNIERAGLVIKKKKRKK